MQNTHRKIVFDTNAILENPSILKRFAKELIMPKTVFDELDYRKTKAEHQEVASLALNTLHNLKITLAVTKLKVHRNDERILMESLAAENANILLLVSNDTAMRTRAAQAKVSSVTLEDFLQQESKSDTALTPKREALYEALLKESSFEVERLLKDEPALHFNFYLKNGYTPLIECVRNKKFLAVDFLLSLPDIALDMADQSKLNLTAFCHASQRRQIKTMTKLLEAGANPHITSRGQNRGNSPLLIAAWDGALNVIQYLVEQPNVHLSLNQADNNGFTPLIKAAIKGHDNIVKYLLDNKVDIYIRDRKDKSAADYAHKNKHENIMRMLKEVAV